MIRKSRGTASGSLVLCAFLWSSAGILIKLVDWDPFAIAGVRSLLACLVMLVVLGKPRFTFSLDQILAGVTYSATMILFVIANKMTTPANAVLLQYTSPVYIIILGHWLLADEKTSLGDWLIVAGILGGMVLFFFDELTVTANIGNLLAVLSGIAFACMTIFMRRQKNNRSADSFMLAHLLTFFVSIPFIIRAGVPSPVSMGGLALLGILQIGLPSVLYGWGVSGVSALSAALITMLEPVLNPVWVVIFTRELPSPHTITGGLIILFFVGMRAVLKKEKI